MEKRNFGCFIAVLLTCVVCVFAAGNQEKSQTISNAPATTSSKVKLGMVSQVFGTQSFQDDVLDGIRQAASKYDLEYVSLEVPDIGDTANGLRTLIAQGANFIIISNSAYLDAMEEVASEYPDVKFFYTEGNHTGTPNIMGSQYAENEGAYLLGALAAMLSKSGNVGTVAAVKGEKVQERFTWGFAAGAKTINPNIVVQRAYTNSYADVNKGNEVASVMYQKGADIVSTYAGACNLGVFNAAKLAGDGKYCFGAAKGQFDKMPDKIIASLVKPIDLTILSVISDYIDTSVFDSEISLTLGVGNNGVICRYTDMNDSLRAMVLPEHDAKIQELKEKIISGEIVPPSTEGEYNSFTF
ncbi:MAG: BMP family protein [Sphaerochaetaceae bacterium]|nr:BMP family protein [Candidatus Gastranaerophilales bacterium]MDD7201074.1 BMP family protein [Spirochaetales bacterium]MDY5500578.1 BMP family protein [Sphaerochaetaceae bacterium]